MAPRKPKVSRADAGKPGFPNYFNFAEPAALFAPSHITKEQLRALFDALDRADESYNENARTGALGALSAIDQFLQTVVGNRTGRFSRPLALLHDELRACRPSKNSKRILPEGLGAAGAPARRRSDDDVKAASAVTLDLLHTRAGQTVNAAAKTVAMLLASEGFRFGKNRDAAERQYAVVAWRKDYLKGVLSKSHIAIRAKQLNQSHALKFGEDVARNRAAILSWFRELLARAGYGATA